MAPLMGMYHTLSKRSQHTKQPVAHRMAASVLEMYSLLDEGFVGSDVRAPNFPAVYSTFRGALKSYVHNKYQL